MNDMTNQKTRLKKTVNRSQQFLNSARDLFFKKGYQGTTIEQIAKKAGYSKRAVYMDYKNKDELFMYIVAEGVSLLLNQVKEINHDQLSVEKVIEQFFDIYIQFSRDHREYFRIIFNEAKPEIIQNASIRIQQKVSELERACLNEVVKVAERAIHEKIVSNIDPWETAGIFIGSITGIILLSMGGSQTVFTQDRLNDLGKRAIQLLWLGIQTQHENGKQRLLIKE